MTTRTKLPLQMLDRAQSLQLLRTQDVGRVAFSREGRIELLPVNYAMDGDVVVFATAAGTKLWWVERGPVTFEADWFDPTAHTAWSVVIHGTAHVVSALEPAPRLERLSLLPVHPWADGDRPHYVRIEPDEITGRRIGPLPAV